MTQSKIPTEMVDKYFQMDPETDDLLPTGDKLEVGMVVLIEDYTKRIAIPEGGVVTLNGVSQYLALESNRWCRISDVKVVGMSLSFVATYADGTKRKRFESVTNAWYVKKDSKPWRPSQNMSV